MSDCRAHKCHLRRLLTQRNINESLDLGHLRGKFALQMLLLQATGVTLQGI